jgi:hypothetical protein
MSYLGNVGLSNKTDGLYLGLVNLSLNTSPNQLLYSPSGYDISGLAVSDGLNISGTNLKTVGNKNIQLTAHSLFANENLVSIQSKINNLSQADVIYISSGSYSENLTINNKYNIALQAPYVGNTICQITGLSISGTSELIRIANLQIFGAESNITGVGRNYFNRCTWQGSAVIPHIINIGAGVSKYMTFENCEFDQYCTINVSAYLANVIYFINCNFGGAVLNLNQSTATQVIINNCAGHISLPTNATLIGMNILTTGQSRNSATTIDNLYFKIANNSTSSSSNEIITTNGTSGLKLSPMGGYSGMKMNYYYREQQTVKGAVSTLTLYEGDSTFSITPNYRQLLNCIFNFNVAGGNTDLTFNLIDITTGNVSLDTVTQSINGNNHHVMPVTFKWTQASGQSSIKLKITVSLSAGGTASTGIADFISIQNIELSPAS